MFTIEITTATARIAHEILDDMRLSSVEFHGSTIIETESWDDFAGIMERFEMRGIEIIETTGDDE